MRHVPWFTLAALAAVAISPLGQSVIHSAFFSGEQLSRTLGQFLLEVILAIAAGVALLEWTIRYFLRKRRSKQAVTPSGS